MYRLTSQQQPSIAGYSETCKPKRSRHSRPTWQPGHRRLWQQAKDVPHWRPYSVQTQVHDFEEYGPSQSRFSNASSSDKDSLPVQDPAAMIRAYENAFEKFQQTNCRVLAKAYIKLLEPRKQVNFPYNGRKSVGGRIVQLDPEETKPPWWPSRVRHREPDHLPKSAFDCLFISSVNFVESHGINVDVLKVADQPIRDQIRPKSRLRFLEEIYNIGEAEERFLNGQTVKQSPYPDVFDIAKSTTRASGPTRCTGNDRDKTQSAGSFVSGWAYNPDFNTFLASFTYRGSADQHVSPGQGENYQDHGQSLFQSGHPAIPFHTQHSRWEPGPLETALFTGSTCYMTQIPTWYEGAQALPQGEIQDPVPNCWLSGHYGTHYGVNAGQPTQINAPHHN